MKSWREIEPPDCAGLKRTLRIGLTTKLIVTDQFILVSETNEAVFPAGV